MIFCISPILTAIHIYLYNSYAIDNYDDGFIIDLRVDICLPFGDETHCIPKEGLTLLDKEKIPACSLAAWSNITSKYQSFRKIFQLLFYVILTALIIL
jgi:hypothetical protein